MVAAVVETEVLEAVVAVATNLGTRQNHNQVHRPSKRLCSMALAIRAIRPTESGSLQRYLTFPTHSCHTKQGVPYKGHQNLESPYHTTRHLHCHSPARSALKRANPHPPHSATSPNPQPQHPWRLHHPGEVQALRFRGHFIANLAYQGI